MATTDIIDFSLIIVSILLSLTTVYALKNKTVRKVPAFFLVFAPMLVFMNMWAHSWAILIVNYERYVKGGFTYSFTFYGLLLMGFAGLMVSGLNIHVSKKMIKGELQYKKTILLLNLITTMIFLPIGFINPLGFLPVLCSIASTITVLLVKPSRVLQPALA